MRRFLLDAGPLAVLLHDRPAATAPIMERYADLRLGMRRPHGSGLIGDVDTLIAATALERRVQVVTTDGDFLRVPDLGVLLLDRTSLTVIENRSPNR